MVKIILCSYGEFILSTLGKMVYCFGAGKNFRRLVNRHPDITLSGVIDNYCGGQNEYIEVNGRHLRLLSFGEYVSSLSCIGDGGHSVIVVTPHDYWDIIELLDADRRLDGTQCFLFSFLMDEFPNASREEVTRQVIQHNNGANPDRHFAEGNRVSQRKHYQIWDCLAAGTNAGSKAPYDVMEIAGGLGYQRIGIHPWHGEDIHSAVPWSRSRNTGDWEKCYHEISDRAIVLLQHPFWQMQPERNRVLRSLKDEKKIRIVSFVHDVEELRRAYYTNEMRREFHFMLEIADVFIVHSEAMKQFLVGKGVKPSHILVLGIFDYLTKHAEIPHREYEKSVIIAGNLASSKGRYLEHLNEIPEILFHLFGSGYHPSKTGSNVKYHGSFPAEKLIESLVGGFGLVWNGDSMETCDGDMGNYLRYNSPHKLSLYIAAGIPPIVWKESASAAFVRDHGIGLEISSLYELPEVIGCVTLEQYREFTSRIKPLSLALRQGAFTRAALERAETVLSGISKESEVASA